MQAFDSVNMLIIYLRARFIAGYEKQRSVHDGSSVQHGGHQNVVTGTVNEADVTHKTVFKAIHLEDVFLSRACRCVTHWTLTPGVFTLVDFGVGITQLDGDISLKFILEPNSVDTRECLDHRGLAVRYMPNCANVDRRLP